jgi:hypothetical protein
MDRAYLAGVIKSTPAVWYADELYDKLLKAPKSDPAMKDVVLGSTSIVPQFITPMLVPGSPSSRPSLKMKSDDIPGIPEDLKGLDLSWNPANFYDAIGIDDNKTDTIMTDSTFKRGPLDVYDENFMDTYGEGDHVLELYKIYNFLHPNEPVPDDWLIMETEEPGE